MRHLTCLEQNAQLYWFYLVWELYRVICKYNLTSLKKLWDDQMKAAQQRWVEKFKQGNDSDSENDDSLCTRFLDKITGKKRKATEDLISPRKMDTRKRFCPE